MTFEPDHVASSAAAPSWWRRAWERVRAARPGLSKTAAPSAGRRRLWRWGAWAILAVVVLYYPVGALIVESIDDDPQFAARNVAPGESRAVATAADLVTREVDVHTWTPMMPFFTPAGILQIPVHPFSPERFTIHEEDAGRGPPGSLELWCLARIALFPAPVPGGAA